MPINIIGNCFRSILKITDKISKFVKDNLDKRIQVLECEGIDRKTYLFLCLSIVNPIIIFPMTSSSFEDSRKLYEAVPHHKRSQFLNEMLETPQLKGEPTIYSIPYPNEGSFYYDSYKLNFHYSETTMAPKAIVVFLHGLYSYGGNSGYLAVNITSMI